MTPAQDALLRGTALVSSACFALALYLDLRRTGVGPDRGRLPWTFGAALCVAHVAAAFHWVHEWSHAHAVAATARQTGEIVGLEFGGGVWANYLLLAVWSADAAWRWLDPRRYWERPRAWTGWILGFLAFILFNATVVFGGWAGRVVGVAGCVLVGVGLLLRRSANAR